MFLFGFVFELLVVIINVFISSKITAVAMLMELIATVQQLEWQFSAC